MANPDDDEWEYEYDENKTEDFYIPLDLSNVPAAQIPMVSQGRPGHPTLLKSRLRALNAARGQPVEFAADANDGQETATMGEVMGEVQVVGLHTPNPLVMYNGQLLSCQWTSTIGTDMFFVKPNSNAATPSQPLRSLPSVDLLSLGSAKLVAKVGRLRPRDDLFDDASDSQQVTEFTNAPGDGQSDTALSTQEAVGGQPPAAERPSNPTGFLAKLNQAKARRGEKTRLVVVNTSEGSRLVSEKVVEQRVAADGSSSQP
ncbi:hypothetical protein EJ02DRAFT_458379 [Clathrospora elynae]|uniref:Transcription factor TFIIIC triple barrel domain-containing protein n=1 Tax=Clathrospora elynae TaxID=706981 RepID=A0A6A5SED7_9PLEO|nr:hypothetical protein EJ02DRAFT_458379 [Clathrospora elynae]